MISNTHYGENPLLDKGHYYLVKQEIQHLKAGSKVRVMNAQYHRAPRSEEGGFIIEFPDMPPVRLDHVFDKVIIDGIDGYLEQLEKFDWDQALRELQANYHEAITNEQEGMKTEVFLHNKKTKELVQALMSKGMTAKEAHKHIEINRLNQ